MLSHHVDPSVHWARPPVTSPRYTDRELFDCGTLLKLRMRGSSAKERKRNIVARASLAVLVGWVPLLVLATYQSTTLDQPGLDSFFPDFAVSCRSLIAAPLLVLAEWTCIPHLGAIALHFRKSGIVAQADDDRFESAWYSTLRLRESTTADIAIILIAYALIAVLISAAPMSAYPAWHVFGPIEPLFYSPAGWWHALISLPLLFALLLSWVWRLFLWVRFLFLMSRLPLRLLPAHPDRTAGLRFVAYSVQSFALVAFSLGVIAAGSAAKRVYQGVPFESLAMTVLGLVAFVLFVFSGPLFIFLSHLLRAWKKGTLQYSALAGKVGRQLEDKWFRSGRIVSEAALNAQDFSATTDLYQVASNVYEVRLIPFSAASLGILVAMTVAPFFGVALMFVPIQVIVREIATLLI